MLPVASYTTQLCFFSHFFNRRVHFVQNLKLSPPWNCNSFTLYSCMVAKNFTSSIKCLKLQLSSYPQKSCKLEVRQFRLDLIWYTWLSHLHPHGCPTLASSPGLIHTDYAHVSLYPESGYTVYSCKIPSKLSVVGYIIMLNLLAFLNQYSVNLARNVNSIGCR